MATVHFSNVTKLGIEVHEMPNHHRTAFHILIDSHSAAGPSHEEVVIMWNGDKDALLAALGITLPETKQ